MKNDKNKYKLIAIDVDGTLVNSKKEMTKENAVAISKASNNGVIVLIASGRPLSGLKQYESPFTYDTPFITFNGSYIVTKDTKKVISFADLNMLKKIKANIEAHKKANELLYNLPVTFEQHNEFHINWEVEKFNIQCKSLLDRVCFDHVNKKIILIDLKTTQNVYNFAHSVEEYDYYRQIAYYGLAIQWYMQEVLNLNSDEYDFEAYIIAIGKDANNEIRVFNMKDDTMLNNRIGLISDTLKQISWHISTDQWEHSQKYYESDGTEELYG